VYSKSTEKVYNGNHTNPYTFVAKNEWSYTYTDPIFLHEMHRINSAHFIFITKRHAFTFLKKKIITFKPMTDSKLTHFK
jgi:hypothetical protein